MCAIPFGLAVVPDVYIRKSRSSASIGSQGQLAGSSERPAQASAQKTSRPACIATGAQVRCATTTVCTFGASASASSAMIFRPTGLPRPASTWRSTQLWQTLSLPPMYHSACGGFHE